MICLLPTSPRKIRNDGEAVTPPSFLNPTTCIESGESMGKGRQKAVSLEERFHTKYEIQPDGCWFWKGSKNFKGYGYIWGGPDVGKKLAAHRVSYEMHCGPIKEGMLIGHTCDNPSCVNPEHLQQMTPQENMDDKIVKGHQSHRYGGFRRTNVQTGSHIEPESRIDIFMKMVDIDPRTGCWNYNGFINSTGYGVTSIYGKQERAHRAAWILFNGEIPDLPNAGYHGTCIRHKCDNRRCCNPDHLELGTHTDNMQDMVKRNRRPKKFGSDNHASTLTEQEVRLIKQFLIRYPSVHNVPRSRQGSGRFLSRWFGVDVNTICYINKEKRWSHI